MSTANDIQIHYPFEVYQKIMHWVKKSPHEISGFGNVTYDKKTKVFTVVDVFLINQINSAAQTETDDVDLGKLLFQQDKAYGEGACKLWWHSHANMNTFWSGTDIDTINKYGGNGYIIATVFNKKEEMRSAVCFKANSPMFGPSVSFIDDVDTFYLHPESWDTEYDSKITEYAKKVTEAKAHNNDQLELGTEKVWDYDAKCFKIVSTNKDMPKNKYVNGLLGMGLELESEALNMTTDKYELFLATASEEKLEEKEQELVMLDAAGYFTVYEQMNEPTYREKN